LADTSSPDADLKGTIESGSREDLVRSLFPLVAGMIARRAASPQDARGLLAHAMKAVASSRRRLKGGSVRAGILKVLGDRDIGSAADGVSSGLGDGPRARAVADALVTGDAEGLDELALVMAEGLTFKEAGRVTGDPPAVVERRAAMAFARAVAALASGTPQ
jgi:hypothetical protein